MRAGRSKFGAKPTVIRHAGKDVRCASHFEAVKLAELVLLERAGKINRLEMHPRVPLIVNGQKICTYVGDAMFFENSRRVIFEAKGAETAVWRIKQKMFLALYPETELRVVFA